MFRILWPVIFKHTRLKCEWKSLKNSKKNILQFSRKFALYYREFSNVAIDRHFFLAHWRWYENAHCLGTALTILTRVTRRLSENCGGGARTSATSPLAALLAATNSGGGGTTSSMSSSNGGGSWARDTAFRVNPVLCKLTRGRVDESRDVVISADGHGSWSELTPLEELSPSSILCSRKSFG